MDWTQDELAEKLSCKKTAVSKWEANKSIPSVARIKVIAKTFGITPRNSIRLDWTRKQTVPK